MCDMSYPSHPALRSRRVLSLSGRVSASATSLLLSVVLVLPLQVMALEPEAAIDATASALPEAKSVDLDQPVSNEELLESANTQQPPSETQAEPDAGECDEPAIREGTGVLTDKLSALNPPTTLLRQI